MLIKTNYKTIEALYCRLNDDKKISVQNMEIIVINEDIVHDIELTLTTYTSLYRSEYGYMVFTYHIWQPEALLELI